MPTIVVVETEIETVLSWGIKIDIAVVSAAKLSTWSNRLADQTPVRIISYQPTEHPLISALNFLATTEAKAVNCLVKATDEIKLIERFHQFDLEVFCERVRWSWIKNGHVDKWYEADTQLFLFPDDRKLDQPEFSSGKYLVQSDGIIHMKASQSFWIGEKLN